VRHSLTGRASVMRSAAIATAMTPSAFKKPLSC
jgi:hypothetical protein